MIRGDHYFDTFIAYMPMPREFFNTLGYKPTYTATAENGDFRPNIGHQNGKIGRVTKPDTGSVPMSGYG